MAVSPGFAEMLIDALAPLGPVTVRRMFGGGGVYCDGVMFGLIADDALHFKADESSRQPFEDEACSPFVFEGKGRTISTSYWRIPERLLDNADELVDWARVALGVARRAAAKKGKPRAKAKASSKRPR